MLRNIPSVNDLLELAPLKTLLETAESSRTVVVGGVRRFLDKLRHEIKSSVDEAGLPSAQELAQRIADWITKERRGALRRVINATGVVLHTGLGRAPWPTAAIDAVREVAQGYVNLEIDLASGQRSNRALNVEPLLRELTGAEAATVVNNNAAATMLTLAALASGREVIVSRGQLVEIGGSYRLPEVMAFSGVRLREVGATNKTRIADYREAITTETAALMRVHTSNYRIVGFHEEASLSELVELGQKRRIPVVDDIGSGALIHFERFGLQDEPVARQSIQAGADVVMFSGDKLLGGPQCGIIVGKRAVIDSISKHPLMRAVRLDKSILAALAATLQLYQDLEVAAQHVPLLAMLDAPLANLQLRAQRLAAQLSHLPAVSSAEARPDEGMLGGGSAPNQPTPTWCVAVQPREGDASKLSAALREGHPSIFGRIHRDHLLLDLRTVFPAEEAKIVEAFAALRQPSLPQD